MHNTQWYTYMSCIINVNQTGLAEKYKTIKAEIKMMSISLQTGYFHSNLF